MWHRVEDVARERRIDVDHALTLAIVREEEFGIIRRPNPLGGTSPWISTWDVDKFIAAAKAA